INEVDNDECPRECHARATNDAFVLSRIQLTNAFFRKTSFQGALFDEAIMDGSDFRCAFLDGSKIKLTFEKSSLIRANFRGTCARDVFFGSVNFDSAQILGMICMNCVFEGATMSHAHLNKVYAYR
ncbi:unnamed protein product, partial [Rotaria sp. Silwood2]